MINNKKTNLFFIIPFFIYCPVFGQQIKFEVYMKDACTDSTSKLMFFNLKKDGRDYYPENNDGIVFLKEKGKYELTTIYSEDIKVYELNGINNIIDTIWAPTIRQCIEPTSNPNFVGYCCCDILCNGKQIDYYSNGNKRLEGIFENGRSIKKLKFYYTNGSLKQTEKYNKKGVMVRRKNYKQN